MQGDLTSCLLEVDVCIVGGGVSGLTAAYHILKKDSSLSVVILEAKDRIGGRLLGKTLQGASGKDKWDVGGQWVGSCQPHVMQLLDELKLDVFEQFIEGKKVLQIGDDSSTSTYSSEIPSLPWYGLIDLHFFIQKVENCRKLVSVDDPQCCPFARDWDSMTLDTFLRRQLWTKSARDVVDAVLRCAFGMEAAQMSFLYYLLYTSSAGGVEPLISANKDGGQRYRIKEGAFSICERLADIVGRDLIVLGRPVYGVTQTDKYVDISTLSGHSYRCDRLILAIPPNQAAQIQFNPVLPSAKLHVLNSMPVGYLSKIVITYKEAFWRKAGLSGEAVTSGVKSVMEGCDSEPLCITYDATSAGGNPALVTFIGGSQQLMYLKKSPEKRKEAVLHQLVGLFGPESLGCLDYCEMNWNEEPYNGGCPVCVASPGIVTDFSPGLRKPFQRVHFAGTESATVWCGFMNGAIQAGHRAAIEVLYHLRPHCVTAPDLVTTCYGIPRTHNSLASPRSAHVSEDMGIPIRRHFLHLGLGLGVAFLVVALGKRACFRMAF